MLSSERPTGVGHLGVMETLLTDWNKKGTLAFLSRWRWRVTVTDDKRSAWLQKLDQECPYQVVLPRRQLMDDSAIIDFLLSYVGKFDLYVEDQCPAYVRYCFEEPMDAAIFRSRFERRSESFRLAG
jgi:hypothetical protein